MNLCRRPQSLLFLAAVALVPLALPVFAADLPDTLPAPDSKPADMPRKVGSMAPSKPISASCRPMSDSAADIERLRPSSRKDPSNRSSACRSTKTVANTTAALSRDVLRAA